MNRFNRNLKHSILLSIMFLSLFANALYGRQINIRLIYTNDEHGKIDSDKISGGASALMHAVETERESNKDGITLVLSGGDNWTGPAVATMTKGEPVCLIFNQIAYDASAVGNHEFDFGIDVERRNFMLCKAPHLAANIVMKADSSTPDFIKPYIIKKYDNLRIGITALTTTETPSIAFERNVGRFLFLPYDLALDRVVPKMKTEGADLIIALCHVCSKDADAELVPSALKHGIVFIGAGHCHDTKTYDTAGITVIETGSSLANYGKTDMVYDSDSRKVVSQKSIIVPLPKNRFKNNAEIITSEWIKKTDAILGEVIGFAGRELDRFNDVAPALLNSWLEAFPGADIAVVNRGGVRREIPAGNITPAAIYAVLPFENDLYMIEVEGKYIADDISRCNPVCAGIAYDSTSGKYFLKGGVALDPDKKYKVVLSNFLYSGGDKFTMGKRDPNPQKTALNSRDPFMDMIRKTKSSKDNPFEDCLKKLIR